MSPERNSRRGRGSRRVLHLPAEAAEWTARRQRAGEQLRRSLGQQGRDQAPLGHAGQVCLRRRRVERTERGDELPDVVHALQDGQAVLAVARRREGEALGLHEQWNRRAVGRGDLVEVQRQVRRHVAMGVDDELPVPAERRDADERERPARQHAGLAGPRHHLGPPVEGHGQQRGQQPDPGGTRQHRHGASFLRGGAEYSATA